MTMPRGSEPNERGPDHAPLGKRRLEMREAAERDGQLWALALPGGQWLLEKDDEGGGVFPVWPHESAAAEYARGTDLRPLAISLDEWFRDWVPELTESHERVSIWPGADVPADLVDPALVVGNEENGPGLEKVLLAGPQETVWARRTRDDEYELANSPFFADYSWLDIVRCQERADGQLEAKELVCSGGHTTIRVLFHPLVEQTVIDAVLTEIVDLGASYEGIEGFYYAVDLPSDVDGSRVRDLLLLRDNDVLWEEGLSERFANTVLEAVEGVGRTAEHTAPLGDQEAEAVVFVDIDENSTTKRRFERLFATPVGDEYRILNAPYFARGLAYGDLVRAEREPGRHPLLQRVSRRSGHYTVRVVLEHERFLNDLRGAVEAVAGRLEHQEGTNLLAVDVRGDAEARLLTARLDTLEREGRLDYETGW